MSKDGKFEERAAFEEGLAKLSDGVNKSSEALKTAQQIISSLESSDWKGEAKDAYVTLIRLTTQYHESLQKMLEKNHEELKNLQTATESWLSSSSSIGKLEEA